MRRPLSDFWLGLRLAVTGGQDSRWRAALTAVGVAFGVTLLLVAASVPHIVSAHNARVNARVPVYANSGHTPLLMLLDATQFRGHDITVVTLQQTGAHAPVPPGLKAIPKPGRMFVSPAARQLLRADGGELATRMHSRDAGLIGETGLTGPNDLYIYRGSSRLREQPDASVIKGFNPAASGTYQGPIITLLVILMAVALLLPIGVFVATATRFGSEQRNVRLAALRLLGADRVSTARIAAGEALLGAGIGVIAGIGLFAALRPLIPHVSIAGVSIFSSDVTPSITLGLLAIVLVPAAAVGFALLGMRAVAIEPLGVTRHVMSPRRRLVWRLIMPLVGFAILASLIGSRSRLAATSGQIEASAGVVLVLIGVCALLPWLVETTIRRAGGGGPLPWLLAMRRLRIDHGTSGRVVGAIGLTVAGAIALQTLFSAASVDSRQQVNSAPNHNTVQTNYVITHHDNASVFVDRKLSTTPGVRSAEAVATVAPNAARSVTVAPCSTLARFVQIKSCGPDSAFIYKSEGVKPLRPGVSLNLDGRRVTVPATAQTVPPARQKLQTQGDESLIVTLPVGSLLVTPHEAARLHLKATDVDAIVQLSGAVPHALGRVSDTVAAIDPLASVDDVAPAGGNHTLASLHRVLTVGATAVLLVIGASLLVAAAEQLRERRRVLAVLAAFGTRRSTLAASIFWQTALPVTIGLVLAVALGTGLGAILMKVVNLPIAFDWGAILLLAGTGLVVVTGVTGLTLPMLWGQMRPEALRDE